MQRYKSNFKWFIIINQHYHTISIKVVYLLHVHVNSMYTHVRVHSIIYMNELAVLPRVMVLHSGWRGASQSCCSTNIGVCPHSKEMQLKPVFKSVISTKIKNQPLRIWLHPFISIKYFLRRKCMFCALFYEQQLCNSCEVWN